MQLVKEACVYKENFKYGFVINRKVTNTAISRDIVKFLNKNELNILNSHICQRVILAETAASGLTVMDLDPEGKASKKIDHLVKETQYGDNKTWLKKYLQKIRVTHLPNQLKNGLQIEKEPKD